MPGETATCNAEDPLLAGRREVAAAQATVAKARQSLYEAQENCTHYQAAVEQLEIEHKESQLSLELATAASTAASRALADAERALLSERAAVQDAEHALASQTAAAEHAEQQHAACKREEEAAREEYNRKHALAMESDREADKARQRSRRCKEVYETARWGRQTLKPTPSTLPPRPLTPDPQP